MPFAQLRALVIAAMGELSDQLDEMSGELSGELSDELDDVRSRAEHLDDDSPEREFESQPTTYMLNRPRVSTLDALVAALPPRR